MKSILWPFRALTDGLCLASWVSQPALFRWWLAVALVLSAMQWGSQAHAQVAAAPLSPTTAAAAPAFAFRDSADGISCKYFDVALGLHWPDESVSWVDAAGLAGGSKAFDTQLLESRQPPRVLRWNVLALVKAWASGTVANEGLVLAPLGVKSGGGADFHSREAADVSLRPSLRVQHANGAVEFLSPQADAHLDCSTFTGLGAREVLHIGPGSVGVLRFDLAKLRKGPASAVAAAELILVRNAETSVWSDGMLGVYRLSTPWSQPFEAPPSGLAAAFSGDRGIESHPAVLWVDTFAAGKLKPGWNKAQMVAAKVQPPVAAPAAGNQLLVLPGLQATVPKGEHLGLDLRYDLPKGADKLPLHEAYFRYYLRLGPEWVDSPDTGKLPGFAGTYNRAGWGGRGWNGMQGWSARGSFSKSLPAPHPANGLLPLGSYVYHSKSASPYGDVFVWGGSNGVAMIKPGRWVCIEQHIRLNAPGREDGVLRVWVDGQPVFARRNLRLRDTPAVGIENVWFDLYMGGQQPALRDMGIQIAHVVVASRYIGPLSP
jgi:hypothetical protein